MYINVNGENREMNAKEITQFEKDQAEYAEQQRLIEAEQTAKAEAKAALLDRLGITEDEAKLLLS